ncbi:MAG: argininosuccinate lyase [Bacteroidales bacterium]|nr:argininosuccinate lyase [Bacteroidales bacterium]
MAKLWDKGFGIDSRIEKFTVGRDRELDVLLAPYDIEGTMAHIRMLESVGLLEKSELDLLLPELEKLRKEALGGNFHIDDDVEDVHSQVEFLLTSRLGDLGKKVHTGRSRNDQIMVDLKLFARAGVLKVADRVRTLFDTLQKRSEECKDILMPGYTHLQVAMPSSFGLWFGAYAESLAFDMQMLLAAWKLTNTNPLGSAAGYGSSAPLNRRMTTELLDFEDLDYNSVFAQMCRGKMERSVCFALSCVAETLCRLACDCCLYNSQNFAFIKLPKEMTTGSSIMPHKKNPDVFELIRARCNHIISTPEAIRNITANLPSGYFRDMQILKEIFIPVFEELCDCLDIATFAIENIAVSGNLMDDPKYRLAFSVEEVNRLVAEGVPFRDAYRQVGMSVENGTFEYHGTLNHTHEGSVNRLCNAEIKARMESIMAGFRR